MFSTRGRSRDNKTHVQFKYLLHLTPALTATTLSATATATAPALSGLLHGRGRCGRLGLGAGARVVGRLIGRGRVVVGRVGARLVSPGDLPTGWTSLELSS